MKFIAAANRYKPTLALALASGATVVLWSLATEPAPSLSPHALDTASKPSMSVTVIQPVLETLPMTLKVNGNVAAWQEASLGAEVNALRLATVNVDVGDMVHKGQVLATFGDESVRAEVLQSLANEAQARAFYLSAKAEADRARTVQDTGALSGSEVAQYLMQESVAQAQWDAAKAAHLAAEIRLKNTTVKSPDHGVISARSATVGAVVSTGQELFRLIRQGRVEWRAEVMASEVGQVRVGQSVLVTLATGLQVNGKVRAIAPSASDQTRNILVYVDLSRQEDLKVSIFARGEFVIGKIKALTVPAQAVVIRDGRSFVFVVSDEGQVNALKVQTGRQVHDWVEVTDGLKGIEQVVVQGAGFLNEGDFVKVVQ